MNEWRLENYAVNWKGKNLQKQETYYTARSDLRVDQFEKSETNQNRVGIEMNYWILKL